jgi:LysM repeat protein
MRIFSVFFFLCFTGLLLAQPASKRISRSEYIEMYKDEAIKEMHRSGVPASITLAQGILESGDGNSPLARYANNHFGIKCHSDWQGKTFIQDDDARDECFRSYKHPLESFHDHSEFLKRSRYAALFELKLTDYKGWAHGLKKAGYATNPRYPELLIDIIEKNGLAQYDREKAPKRDPRKDDESERKLIAAGKNRSGAHRVAVHANNIRYIELRESDDLEAIADEFNMGLWQLYKYNDLEKGEELPKAGPLFLQPKRGKAQEDYHIVKTGESMWDISQQHGVKLKKLYKKNRLNAGEQPEVGQKLYLRKKKR